MTKQIENMTHEEVLHALEIELNSIWGFEDPATLPDVYTVDSAAYDMKAYLDEMTENEDYDNEFFQLLLRVSPAEYAGLVQALIDSMILEYLGYDGPMTPPVDNTFRADFRIAERFGKSAIEDTYKRSLESFRDDVQYMSALAIALNERLWATYEGGRRDLALTYNKLWEACVKHCTTHFKGARLRYYYAVTD